MLHLILVILKLIGILFAVLILLLLLLTGLVLFVPLRYEISGSYHKETYGVGGSVSWILGLLKIQGSFEKGKGLSWKVKAAWFSLPKEEKTKVKKTKSKKSPVKTETPKIETSKSEIPKAPEPGKTEEFLKEPPVKAPKPKEPAAEAIKEMERKSAASIPEAVKESVQNPKEASEKTSRNSFVEKFSSSFEIPVRILDRIRKGIRKLIEKLRRIRENLKKTARKLQNLKEKVQVYLDFYHSEEVQTVLKEVKRYLTLFWKHYRPRKAEGYLKFGFTDPSLTGQAAGILYLLTASPGQEFALYPEFETEELLLDGEAVMTGHIRLCYLAKAAVCMFFDKNLRRAWKRLKMIRGKR